MRISNASRTTDTWEGPTQAWHAVAIRCGRYACRAAQDLAGTRFLSADAPMLPLANCDRSGPCECNYRHYPDRRAGPRRRSEGALPAKTTTTTRTPPPNRRNTRGRRKEDWVVSEPDGATRSPRAGTYYEYVSRHRKP